MVIGTSHAQTLEVNIGGDREISGSEARTIAARREARSLLCFDQGMGIPERSRAAYVSLIVDRTDSGVRSVFYRVVRPL